MVAKSPIWHSSAGEGPPVILLHGLFGAGSNLGALARALSDRYTVYSLDLPNHGRSAWTDRAGPAAMAEVLGQWMAGQGLSSAACVGHSLGGKVMMELALSQPAKVPALVVADIAPVEYPDGGHDTIFTALDAVAAQGPASRNAAGDILAQYIDDPGVVQFLLTSLQRGEDGSYDWRFNFRILRDNYAAVRGAPVARGPYPGPVLFVKGGDSDYIQPQHREQVMTLFPQAEMKVLAGCGHWLHAEQPEQFNRVVGRFLDRHAGAD